MFEIMFHGRGGQGAVLAATLLANTAARSGCQAQAFASYGGERRGGKVESYVRIAGEKVLLHSKVYQADLLVLMDDSIARNSQITSNIKKGTIVLINSARPAEEFSELAEASIVTIDANRIALEKKLTLPSGMPIINTTILGAIVALVPMVGLEHLIMALEEGKIPVPAKNVGVAREAFLRIKNILEYRQPKPCGENAAPAEIKEKFPRYITRMPPCTANCPAGEDIERTAFFIRGGCFEEALANIRRENPFAGVCGRVCPHPCTKHCNRIEFDEGLSANCLEKAAFDFADRRLMPGPESKPSTGKRVAVIGAGPAGITCAYYLSQLGHKVTVFESSPFAGGIPRLGIPGYRLPEEIVDREIREITGANMEINLNTPVGDEAFASLTRDFDACFVAVGAHRPVKLEVAGENLDDVYQGLSFLKDIKEGKKPEIGREVVVIGGGNVAVDVALSALRLGAREVKLVCLENKEEMPAYKEEIAQAEEEGIKIFPSWGVKRVIGPAGKIKGIELKACTRVYDQNGQFSPCYDEQKTRTMKADCVIVAVGQSPELSFLKGSHVRSGRSIEVDAGTLSTSVPGIFAGGDATGLSNSVAAAVAAGKRAAVSIDLFLQGIDVRTIRTWRKNEDGALSMSRYLVGDSAGEFEGVVEYKDLNTAYFEHRERVKTDPVRVKNRVTGFTEVNPGFHREQAVEEAERCFHCGRCTLCENCYIFCPDLAVSLGDAKETFDINRTQCKVCGICINECPRAAIGWEGDER